MLFWLRMHPDVLRLGEFVKTGKDFFIESYRCPVTLTTAYRSSFYWYLVYLNNTPVHGNRSFEGWIIRTNDNGYYDVRRCLSLCCEIQFHSCDIDRNDYLKPPQDYVSVVTVCLSAPSRCISFVGHHVTSFSVEPPVRFWQNQRAES